MSDEDLIWRGDVSGALPDCGFCDCQYTIDALPARYPAVKPLEWLDFDGRGAKAKAWGLANYIIQKWRNGRWELSASYPGYSTGIDGVERFHTTLEAAKAAAQADYGARILAAITMQPSPDMSALTAENAKLRDDLTKAMFNHGITLHEKAAEVARAEEAEAKLKKAVEALELYSCADGCNECPEHERDRVGCGWTAYTALAKLKGGDA